jgi:hypothetical protein
MLLFLVQVAAALALLAVICFLGGAVVVIVIAMARAIQKAVRGELKAPSLPDSHYAPPLPPRSGSRVYLNKHPMTPKPDVVPPAQRPTIERPWTENGQAYCSRECVQEPRCGRDCGM